MSKCVPRAVVALLALVSLGLAACDGSGEVTTEDGGSATATGTGSGNGSGTATGTGTGSGSGTGTGVGAEVSIEGKVNNHGTEALTGSSAELELEAGDFYFGPTFVSAEPGSTITVKIHNEGEAAHTFTIDALEVDEELDPGAEAEVEVTLPDSGTTVFYCRFHEAEGMQGAFHFA